MVPALAPYSGRWVIDRSTQIVRHAPMVPTGGTDAKPRKFSSSPLARFPAPCRAGKRTVRFSGWQIVNTRYRRKRRTGPIHDEARMAVGSTV